MKNALFTTRKRTPSGTGIGKRAARGLATVVAAIALMGLGGSAKADTITYFDFNDATPSQATLLASDGGRASTITTNFPDYGTAGGITTFGGTTVNAVPNGVAGNALALVGGTSGAPTANNGKYIQFGIDTTGYNGIVVSLATQRTSTGFGPTASPNIFRYSTDGGITFTDVSYTPAASFATQTFDLSSITGLNNNANAVFQIVFNGASSASGNNRIDNLRVDGNNATATPEPETWAMMGLGVFALGVFHIRRRRTSDVTPLPAGLAF